MRILCMVSVVHGQYSMGSFAVWVFELIIKWQLWICKRTTTQRSPYDRTHAADGQKQLSAETAHLAVCPGTSRTPKHLHMLASTNAHQQINHQSICPTIVHRGLRLTAQQAFGQRQGRRALSLKMQHLPALITEPLVYFLESQARQIGTSLLVSTRDMCCITERLRSAKMANTRSITESAPAYGDCVPQSVHPAPQRTCWACLQCDRPSLVAPRCLSTQPDQSHQSPINRSHQLSINIVRLRASARSWLARCLSKFFSQRRTALHLGHAFVLSLQTHTHSHFPG